MELNDLVNKTRAALESRDAMMLRELSREFTDEAIVSQDENVIKLAMITYAFNKILSKVHFKANDELVEKALKKLRENDFSSILSYIDEFDKKFGFFEGTLVGKAKIKIGSRLYSRGISLSRSANLVNAKISDILDYVGNTKIHEKAVGSSLKERLETARRLFK